MAFFSYLFFIVPISFIGIGCLLVYSAFSGKIISEPEKNASFQLYTQYKLRALVGGGFILFGILSFLEFAKDFVEIERSVY